MTDNDAQLADPNVKSENPVISELHKIIAAAQNGNITSFAIVVFKGAEHDASFTNLTDLQAAATPTLFSQAFDEYLANKA